MPRGLSRAAASPLHTSRHRDAGVVIRYAIEVMGFDDPEYERGKADMHRRMRMPGRLFRMEAPQFDSSRNSHRRQRERITADIRNDMLRRWART